MPSSSTSIVARQPPLSAAKPHADFLILHHECADERIAGLFIDVSRPTTTKYRAALEAEGTIPVHEKLVGADGKARRRPAQKTEKGGETGGDPKAAVAPQTSEDVFCEAWWREHGVESVSATCLLDAAVKARLCTQEDAGLRRKVAISNLGLLISQYVAANTCGYSVLVKSVAKQRMYQLLGPYWTKHGPPAKGSK